MLSNLAVRFTVGGRTAELSTFEFPDTLHPAGYKALDEFDVGTVARYRWTHERAVITQEIRLLRGRNAAAIRWRMVAGNRPGRLEIVPFVAARGQHGLRRHDGSGRPEVNAGRAGVSVVFPEPGAPVLNLSMPGATFVEKPDWWFNFTYRAERERGYDHAEDLFTPGSFTVEIGPNRPVVLTASEGPQEPAAVDFDAAMTAEEARRAKIVAGFAPGDEFEARLAAASDAFVVGRADPPTTPAAKVTILAGYPWFGDWGRDTFIALPGLLLCGGRFAEAREVIRTFAAACKDGLIPNRFTDDGSGADYNTVDASLWFVRAVGEYHRAVPTDKDFLRDTALPACEQIVEAYRKGTQFDIHEADDGLIYAGNADTQLTWMDARCNGVSFTPRHGAAVEINALWHHARRTLIELRRFLGKPVGDLEMQAARTGMALVEQFWDPLRNYMADVVLDGRRDMALRPNQLLAVSLSPCPLTIRQQQAVVEAAGKHLLTPVGLRTLAPNHPGYIGRYEGDPFRRDSSYHQGTVWPWLLGPYVEALLRAHDFNKAALDKAAAALAGIEPHLRAAGLGQVSEIFDGDAPHQPRGCIAQAWSAAELIRVRRMLKERMRK
jgi:predicted glycogen debranching enzyme